MKKENLYWEIIKNNSGVLFIQGAPGIAKSAIARTIAEEQDLEYIDIRLQIKDESDLGLYPITPKDNGILKYAVPEWAAKANERPTLIHFEELNRASSNVRNAAMQILLDRQIGENFKFNKDVYMMASGNLGEEDFTDAEELDSALGNRLIHIRHNLSIDEWIDNYASKHVDNSIISYIQSEPHNFLKPVESGPFPSPRSWTFLSDFIKGFKGKDEDLTEMLYIVASGMIGSAAIPYCKYRMELMKLGIKDILKSKDWNKTLEKINSCGRIKLVALMQDLKITDINSLGKKEIKNIHRFLKEVDEDGKVSYLLSLVDNMMTEKSKNTKDIIQDIIAPFKGYLEKIIIK